MIQQNKKGCGRSHRRNGGSVKEFRQELFGGMPGIQNICKDFSVKLIMDDCTHVDIQQEYR